MCKKVIQFLRTLFFLRTFLTMVPGSVETLRKAYEDHLEDVDLFTGGLAEVPTKGAVVGPTFACLIGRQVRFCDCVV